MMANHEQLRRQQLAAQVPESLRPSAQAVSSQQRSNCLMSLTNLLDAIKIRVPAYKHAEIDQLRQQIKKGTLCKDQVVERVKHMVPREVMVDIARQHTGQPSLTQAQPPMVTPEQEEWTRSFLTKDLSIRKRSISSDKVSCYEEAKKARRYSNAFGLLPDAVIVSILSHLSQDFLLRVLGRVDTRFHRLIYDPVLWRECKPILLKCSCSKPKCTSVPSLDAITKLLSRISPPRHMDCLSLFDPIELRSPLEEKLRFLSIADHLFDIVPVATPVERVLDCLDSLQELKLLGLELHVDVLPFPTLIHTLAISARGLSSLVLDIVFSYTHGSINSGDGGPTLIEIDLACIGNLVNLSCLKLDFKNKENGCIILRVEEMLRALGAQLTELHLALPPNGIDEIRRCHTVFNPETSVCLRRLSIGSRRLYEEEDSDEEEEDESTWVDFNQFAQVEDLEISFLRLASTALTNLLALRHLVLHDVRPRFGTDTITISDCDNLLTLQYDGWMDLFVFDCPALISAQVICAWLPQDGEEYDEMSAEFRNCPTLQSITSGSKWHTRLSLFHCPNVQHIDCHLLDSFDDLPKLHTLMLWGLSPCVISQLRHLPSLLTLVIGPVVEDIDDYESIPHGVAPLSLLRIQSDTLIHLVLSRWNPFYGSSPLKHTALIEVQCPNLTTLYVHALDVALSPLGGLLDLHNLVAPNLHTILVRDQAGCGPRRDRLCKFGPLTVRRQSTGPLLWQPPDDFMPLVRSLYDMPSLRKL
mmetsp:Transcript_23902/g.39298  ORF Transcript_23902/g.39298 Transcript_23902/m.39298 type:complete len:755 (+) Transcript_23902:76-2340(+)